MKIDPKKKERTSRSFHLFSHSGAHVQNHTIEGRSFLSFVHSLLRKTCHSIRHKILCLEPWLRVRSLHRERKSVEKKIRKRVLCCAASYVCVSISRRPVEERISRCHEALVDLNWWSLNSPYPTSKRIDAKFFWKIRSSRTCNHGCLHTRRCHWRESFSLMRDVL